MSRVMNVFLLRAVSINNARSPSKRVDYFGFRDVYFIYAKRARVLHIHKSPLRDRRGSPVGI